MAIRQYIGARYTPKFMGTYDNTQSYEALSVVDNGSGTSYINGKPAPAGTPLTDTNYWHIYGASSGAIINLQNQIGNLTDLDTTDKDNLVDAINENVSELQKIPTKRKYVLVGDSFGCGIIGGGQPWTTGWINYFDNLFSGDVFFYDPEGDQSFEGSSAFTTTSDKNFIGQLNYVYDHKLGSTDPELITDIVVLGGSNESTTNANTIALAIDTFCARARELFPNANIAIACIGLDSRTMVKNNVFSGYLIGAQRNGCAFYKELLNLGSNKDYDSGYGHWTESGYQYYNPIIAECIVAGKTHYGWYNTYNLALGPDVSIDGTITFILVVQVTEKGVSVRVIDSTRYRGWVVKNAKTYSGGTLSVVAFTLSEKVYTAIQNGAIVDSTAIAFNNSTGMLDTHAVTFAITFDAGGSPTNHELLFTFFPRIAYGSNTDIAWSWSGTALHPVPITQSTD